MASSLLDSFLATAKENDQVGSASAYHEAGAYDPEGDCCPGIVNPLTLVGLVGGLGLGAWALRQQIVQNIMGGGRRRRERSVAMATFQSDLNLGRQASSRFTVTFETVVCCLA